MLAKEGVAQTARVHLRIKIHVVLVNDPVRAGYHAEEVRRQRDGIATSACTDTKCTACTSVKCLLAHIGGFCVSSDRPVFESLTCSMAPRVLMPRSKTSPRQPPWFSGFTCWTLRENSWRAGQNTVARRKLWISEHKHSGTLKTWWHYFQFFDILYRGVKLSH